jgi:PelA/Pel-15E family pectate lyase
MRHRRISSRYATACVALAVGAACGSAGPGSTHDGANGVPPAGDSLLGSRRIAALPDSIREAWTRYIDASRAVQARDRDSVTRELRRLGRERPTRAPYLRAPFHEVADALHGDTARRVADIVLSFQTPSGGWSKHVDMTRRVREPGESYYSESDGWQYIATIDNGATTGQMRFLARVHEATGGVRYRSAFLRGLDYLEHAQFPNGCWPQVYPLQGGYHDAATFNDDATVNVLRLLRDVARGRMPWMPAVDLERTTTMLARGTDCVLAAQVIVGGTRTAWGQQHDPLTLVPVKARSYEPPSLSGRESAGITELLMTLRTPDERAVEAVHAAVDWFRTTAIHGFEYDFERGLTAKPGAGPIWARMYEIGTNRPLFSNRDGIIRYDWNELTDRRTGYAWFGEEPKAVLERYERWSRAHPRSRASAQEFDL